LYSILTEIQVLVNEDEPEIFLDMKMGETPAEGQFTPAQAEALGKTLIEAARLARENTPEDDLL
jgi:hypothetical protein